MRLIPIVLGSFISVFHLSFPTIFCFDPNAENVSSNISEVASLSPYTTPSTIADKMLGKVSEEKIPITSSGKQAREAGKPELEYPPTNTLPSPNQEKEVRIRDQIEKKPLTTETEQDNLTEKYENNDIDPESDEYFFDFIPDVLTTVRLEPRSKETFFQEVDDKPTIIKGFFLVDAPNKTNPIALTITQPDGSVTLSTFSERDFQFTTKVPGVYGFTLMNTHWVGERTVTLGIGVGNETALQSKDVDDIGAYASQVAHMLNDIQRETLYLWKRQRNQMSTVQQSEKRIYYYAYAELLLMIVMGQFQIYFLKSLVANKRII